MSFDVADLLARAFPAGVPPDEAAHLASLPPARADKVARRLDALLLADAEPRPPLSELAARAGVTRSVFFDLRRRWGLERSLKVLTPFASTATRGAVDRGGSMAAMAAVRRLVPVTPDFVSAGEVARQVMRETKADVDFRTALRLVRKERQLVSTDPTYLRRNYARTVLLDICAIDVPLVGGEPEVAVAALVIERASLLVLGAAAGSGEDMRLLQATATERAIGLLGGETLDRVLPRDEVLVEMVAPDAAGDAAHDLRALAALPGFDVVATGERRFGGRASALLNGRLGNLRLLPRTTTAARPGSAPLSKRSPVHPEHADHLLDQASRHHNLRRIEALRAAAGEQLELVRGGTVTTMLPHVREALRTG